MDHFILQAFNRELTTKGNINKARKEGRIPAVVYGGGISPKNIFIPKSEYIKVHKNLTESTIITLDIEGTKIDAFVKDHQKSTVTKDLLHIDFLAVQAGKKIHAHVPLHLAGTPKSVLEGGILEYLTHEIEIECDPSVLPEKIDIDVSHLEINHPIHVRDIPVEQGMRVITNPETVVAVVKYAKHEEAIASAATAPEATAQAAESASAAKA